MISFSITDIISWVKARLAERTSWDGGVIIGVSLCALIASPFIKWIAFAGLGYGVFTFIKQD